MVPFAAGGSADLIGRILQQHLQAKTGVPIVVENKSGAGGSLGAGFVAKAPADGYTLLIGTVSTNAINAFLYSRLNFDVGRDLQAISLLVRFPNLLFVNPRIPARTVPELIAYLKSHDGQLNYGSSGIGTSSHLSVVMLELATGTKMTHIPFRSTAEEVNNMIGGQLDLAIDSMTTTWPFAQAGRCGRSPSPRRNARRRRPICRPSARRCPVTKRPDGRACSRPPAPRGRSSTPFRRSSIKSGRRRT